METSRLSALHPESLLAVLVSASLEADILEEGIWLPGFKHRGQGPEELGSIC